MAAEKLMATAKIYPLMVDTRIMPSAAELMVKDLNAGVIDAAVVWGPMGGYYAKQAVQEFNVIPLVKEKGGQRMVYRITMGVRPSDQEWKRGLNTFIKEHQQDINALLLNYGVPLLDERDQLLSLEATQ